MTQDKRAPSAIPERQHRLIEEFSVVDSWNDRYQHLCDLGRRLPPMPPALRIERNRIRECQGDTFLAGEHNADRLDLFAESEAPVLAGILAILVDIYSGEKPADVLRYPPILFDRIGLTRNLSPHRRIALLHVHDRLTTIASGFSGVQRLAS